ncbi:ABC transporter permease [Actinokineospora sp. 24-640]
MKGTLALVRLALRRDRVILPIWIALLGLVPASTIAAYDQLYPDAASRAALDMSAGSNPSIAVLYGKAYDLSTAGGFTAWRYGLFLALFTALMAIFTVTRHTRAEEDSGRLELLGSAVVGRYAALSAGFGVAAGASLVIGVLMAAGLTRAGLPGGPSFLLGLGVAGTGTVFAAVSATTAQLTEYARSANGLATTALGVAFLLRGVGDSTVSLGWLSWLSPLGWPQLAQPYVEDRWWVLVLPVGATLVFGALAYSLVVRRDLGAGLLPQRPGPARAPASLNGPLGLAWRLQRGGLLGWTVGMALVGAVFGSIASGVTDLVGTSEQVREIFTRMGGSQALVDTFLAAMASVFGVLAAVYGVQAVLRMRAEEVAVRAEPVLAAGAGRLSWLGSHLVFALGGPAVLLAVSGLAMGLGHGLRAGDVPLQVGHALQGTLAQVAAVWIVVGVAALLFGVLPRVSVPAAWAVLAAVVLLTLFGPALRLDQWVMDVSPFTHVPKIPGAELTVAPLLWLAAVATALLAAALTAFRRRDIG